MYIYINIHKTYITCFFWPSKQNFKNLRKNTTVQTTKRFFHFPKVLIWVYYVLSELSFHIPSLLDVFSESGFRPLPPKWVGPTSAWQLSESCMKSKEDLLPFWSIFLNISGHMQKGVNIETIPDRRPISTNESSSLFIHGKFQDLKNFSNVFLRTPWKMDQNGKKGVFPKRSVVFPSFPCLLMAINIPLLQWYVAAHWASKGPKGPSRHDNMPCSRHMSSKRTWRGPLIFVAKVLRYVPMRKTGPKRRWILYHIHIFYVILSCIVVWNCRSSWKKHLNGLPYLQCLCRKSEDLYTIAEEWY